MAVGARITAPVSPVKTYVAATRRTYIESNKKPDVPICRIDNDWLNGRLIAFSARTDEIKINGGAPPPPWRKIEHLSPRTHDIDVLADTIIPVSTDAAAKILAAAANLFRSHGGEAIPINGPHP
jgi:hypothetical protein